LAFSRSESLSDSQTFRPNAKFLLPIAAYRFDWPRANFFTLRFFDPRA